MNTAVTSTHRVPKTHCGAGCLSRLAHECSLLGAKNLLVVADRWLLASPLMEGVVSQLQAHSIAFGIFSDVRPDPEIEHVQNLIAQYRDRSIDLVLAIGGGSAIDIAKISALGLHESCKGDEFLNPSEGSRALPLVVVPTTAGTGSEVTAVAVLTDAKNQVKKGIVSEQIIPQVVFLDPLVTLSLPPDQTAYTGLDALTHAVEAFTSRNAQPFTDLFAAEAIEIVRENLHLAVEFPQSIPAREKMQRAAYCAGLAFGNAGVTAAHALAYPLGARHHVPHGLAVVLLLPAVLEHNVSQSLQNEKWLRLAALLSGKEDARAEDVSRYVSQICQRVQVKMGLKQIGVTSNELLPMAEAAADIERILKNNPVPLTHDVASIYKIYQRAWEG